MEINVPVVGSSGGRPKPFNVFIEGNIGSGKSTFLERCNNYGEFEVITEPVAEWGNVGGVNLMEKFYAEPRKWAFKFQTYITLTMIRNYLKPTAQPVKVYERSLWSARECFVGQMVIDGILAPEENAILQEWYDHLDREHKVKPDLIVYLRTTPAVAYERMRKRGRASEMNLDIGYLTNLHERHEEWIFEMQMEGIPVNIIEADLTLAGLDLEYSECISNISWAAIANGPG